MFFNRKIVWIFLVLVALTLIPYMPAYAGTVPPGFYPVSSAPGVQLYRKDYPGGSPDFVQVVDLGKGAIVKPLHGSITDPGTGLGVYGGNDARFRSRSLADYWRALSSASPEAFCVFNGQFFYMPEYPTRLPFPLKVDGKILTDGYGIKDFPDKKLILELWPGRADITALSKEALYSSTAPDIIAGLTEDAPKRIKHATGRTFVGVEDQDGDGQFETLLVFNSRIAKQEEAANVLRNFGAQKVMMLDGGGSTQLSCQGKSYVYSERLLPQAIGILAAPAGGLPQAKPPRETLPVSASAALNSPDASPTTDDSVSVPSNDLEQNQQPPNPTAIPVLQSQEPALQTPPSPEPVQSQPQEQAIEQPQVTKPSQPTPTEPVPSPGEGQGLPTSKQPVAEQVVSPPTSEIQSSAAPTQTPLPAVVPTDKPVARSNALALAQSVAQGSQQEAAGAEVQNAGSSERKTSLQPDPSIQIVDVVWVPASMSPVLLILLIAIHKIRSPHG